MRKALADTMNALVLILAPRGRDAVIAADLLGRHNIPSRICDDATDLTRHLNKGAGAVLLTEEALVAATAPEIATWVAGQESWSDIPFVVLANGSRSPRTVSATARLAELGNVVLLERPLHAEAMLGAIRSSLKARARQFEVRDAARLSAAQNRILALAVEAAPLARTLDAIVREFESLSTSGLMGSIDLLDETRLHFRHGAGPSLPVAYKAAIEAIKLGPENGSCGAAIDREEPVCVAEIATDPLRAEFRVLARVHGLHTGWSMPITSAEGELFGTFSIYYREPREPAAADLTIADFVVRTAGIVIGRARAQESLHASEARYRQIVECAEDFAIVTLDSTGLITGWNSGARRLLGYSEQEMVGQAGDIFFTPEDRAADAPAQEMNDAATAGRAANERWHLRKDGSRFWGSGLTMPLADQHDGFVKIFRDRTAEHDAEAALRESETRLRFFGALDERLFGATSAADAMQAAAEMLGQTIDVSRCAYADVHDDNDLFWIRNDYTAPDVATSKGTYSLDLFGPRAAAGLRRGQTLIVRDVSVELQSDCGRDMFQSIGIEAIVCCPLVKHGRLAAMMAVHQNAARDWTSSEIALIREVTERCWAHVERVGAEARLRESEERLRLAVENAEIGFWDVDIINDRLIWPDRTKAMFGISAHIPVTMQDFYDGLHPDDREATAAAYLAAADPGERAFYDVEYRTIGKEDGVLRWVAAKGRGLFDASGRCLRVAGTALDITARKEAEEALRELNFTLESRVAEAVAEREAAHEALRQSQKMEAMGQLTGGVAHDFNNLLTPIVGSLDLLLRKGLGSERERRLIAGAAQSAERARTLVQRLLAFARRQPLQSVSVNISRLIREMGELVESTTGPQVRVEVDVAHELPPAKADPNQLEMALLNLAVNARDAMPDGGSLRISASAETVASNGHGGLEAGEYVRISVTDTGSGMDEATMARAIEPFFSTKGIGKGTGLGLSMAHGLASQLGGALTIQSQLGIGTEISLWLPVSAAAVAEAQQQRQIPVDTAHQGLALLVDDEDLVRMSTADMLADLGYDIVEASSAEEALHVLNTGRPVDVVVTDHLMPGMTGTDLARHVQRGQPHLPILLVSGYAELEGIDADLPRLTKPFRKDDLAGMLLSIMK